MEEGRKIHSCHSISALYSWRVSNGSCVVHLGGEIPPQDKELHVAYGEGCNIDRPKLQHDAWKGPNVCILYKRVGKEMTHLILTSEFFHAILVACAIRFGLKFELDMNISAWRRARIHNAGSEIAIMVVACIY